MADNNETVTSMASAVIAHLPEIPGTLEGFVFAAALVEYAVRSGAQLKHVQILLSAPAGLIIGLIPEDVAEAVANAALDALEECNAIAIKYQQTGD